MKKTIHRADTRGHKNHGWLETFHTFSFASYYDPSRTNFGTLRVLNDDIIQPGMGFGTHPHENMEIISIPLAGVLEHEDSMGNVHLLTPGEIQVMTAGTGIFHSEKNGHRNEPAALLQIWIMPEKMHAKPGYNQRKFMIEESVNAWHNVVGPKDSDSPLFINQQAWIYRCELNKANSVNYTLKNPENGLYLFVIEGKIKLDKDVLSRRDGIGLTELNALTVEAKEQSSLLLLEVPMKR